MKLGILTFHSQLNYGGVLQCWALKTALERLGHDVVVVDRWLSPNNVHLDGPFGHAGFKGWCAIVLKSMMGCGQWKQVLRHWRTRRFVRSINLTPYHFYNWSDILTQDQPFNLDFDKLIVGSDQVWHGGDWGDPRPYLLEGAPRIRAIAYAASFGMKALPDGIDYKAGFKRFEAISVRETEGVGLVESQGAKASHVLDPTLLLEPDAWAELGKWGKVPRRIVCYFLEQNIDDSVRMLESWARRNNFTIEVVCAKAFKAFPKNSRELLFRTMGMLRSAVTSSPVRVCSGYGPREFIRAFAQAEMCITDSFHAVMFSVIYDCNVRFLTPKTAERRKMFSRVEEFAKRCVKGRFFAENIGYAMLSFERSEKISFAWEKIYEMRAESQRWLKDALDR